MEYSFSQLSSIAKSLRERYPIGTRIKLISMGDDPRPIPPGTKGTVEGVDDIATVFCRFDNGRSLGLAYGEDHYRALTQRELLEEKCARNYDKYYDAVHRDIFADVDLDRFAEEIENIIAGERKFPPHQVVDLRAECINEVKRLNGTLTFEEAVEWQNSYSR